VGFRGHFCGLMRISVDFCGHFCGLLRTSADASAGSCGHFCAWGGCVVARGCNGRRDPTVTDAWAISTGRAGNCRKTCAAHWRGCRMDHSSAAPPTSTRVRCCTRRGVRCCTRRGVRCCTRRGGGRDGKHLPMQAMKGEGMGMEMGGERFGRGADM
jgi:hypothetical protein